MEYDLAFRKEDTVSGLSDSSKINMGVYIFFTYDFQHPLRRRSNSIPAERSLNIDHGLTDPLVNGLVLQRFLWDIKWVQIASVS